MWIFSIDYAENYWWLFDLYAFSVVFCWSTYIWLWFCFIVPNSWVLKITVLDRHPWRYSREHSHLPVHSGSRPLVFAPRFRQIQTDHRWTSHHSVNQTRCSPQPTNWMLTSLIGPPWTYENQEHFTFQNDSNFVIHCRPLRANPLDWQDQACQDQAHTL